MSSRSPKRALPSLFFAVALAGCATRSTTQLVVVVDTDFAIPRDVDAVSVEVTSMARPLAQTEREPLTDRSGLPLTLTITPATDSLGPITIVATAWRGTTQVLQRRHQTMLVRGESRWIAMYLPRSCASATCAAAQTCGEHGCTDVVIDAALLPPWTGSAPPLHGEFDAGSSIDGGRLDGGDSGIIDAQIDAPLDGGPIPTCTEDSQCDDERSCTLDSCELGMCRFTATPGAPCDDGEFCNGADTCRESACARHALNPCSGMCDEERNVCIGCVTDVDCPADTTETGDCAFPNPCTTTGARLVRVTSWICNAEQNCESNAVTTSEPCTRAASSTEGMRCTDEDFCMWSGCAGSTLCAQTGSRTETCSGGRCHSGSCVVEEVSTRMESGCPVLGVEGSACGATPECVDTCNADSFDSDCDTTGTSIRTCYTAPTCHSGRCDPPVEMMVAGSACTRSTTGNVCDDVPEECTPRGTCSDLDEYPCDREGVEYEDCAVFRCDAAQACIRSASDRSTRWVADCYVESDGMSCTDACGAGTCMDESCVCP